MPFISVITTWPYTVVDNSNIPKGAPKKNIGGIVIPWCWGRGHHQQLRLIIIMVLVLVRSFVRTTTIIVMRTSSECSDSKTQPLHSTAQFVLSLRIYPVLVCLGGWGKHFGANKGLPFDIPRALTRIVKPRRHGRASLHDRGQLHILKMARASGVFKSKSDISDNLVMVNTIFLDCSSRIIPW